MLILTFHPWRERADTNSSAETHGCLALGSLYAGPALTGLVGRIRKYVSELVKRPTKVGLRSQRNSSYDRLVQSMCS